MKYCTIIWHLRQLFPDTTAQFMHRVPNFPNRTRTNHCIPSFLCLRYDHMPQSSLVPPTEKYNIKRLSHANSLSPLYELYFRFYFCADVSMFSSNSFIFPFSPNFRHSHFCCLPHCSRCCFHLPLRPNSAKFRIIFDDIVQKLSGISLGLPSKAPWTRPISQKFGQ